MKISRQLREQLDACRPGSGDLALPELAELAAAVKQDRAVVAELDRSQRFDATAKAALDDLPMPAGLMERLLAATEANQPTPAKPPVVPHSRTGWTRRRLITAAGSLAATILVAVAALWLVPRRPRVMPQDELSQAVASWLDESNVKASEWLPAQSLSAKFTLPGPVAVPQPNRWRKLSVQRRGWSGNGAVLHLNPPTGQRAILFVVESSVRFQQVSTFPKEIPVSSVVGGGWRAKAWQAPGSNLLYVLVVDEKDGWRLERYLRQQTIG